MIKIYDYDKEKLLVYVSVEEAEWWERLFNVESETAIYYNRKGRKIGYHWLLHPFTAKKLGLQG